MKHFLFRFLLDTEGHCCWHDNEDGPQKALDLVDTLHDFVVDLSASDAWQDRLRGLQVIEVAGPLRCQRCTKYFALDAPGADSVSQAQFRFVCHACTSSDR